MNLQEIEFNYPANINYFIIPLLIIIIIYFSYQKRDRIIKQFNLKINYRYKVLKTILITLSIILIVFSLLAPQKFTDYQEIEKKGLDIYVLIDISRSMLAEDVKPNRLIWTKRSIENLIDSLEGDRIGFIPFASDAFIQMPLTNDYNLAKTFLQLIDPGMILGGGTNIASAINLAARSFDKAAQSDQVIILFSDGEEHNEEGLQAAQNVVNDNLRIFTVGIGSEQGALVPRYNDTGYKRDREGNFVISKLNPFVLREIARVGNANYYFSQSGRQEIDDLINDISYLKREQLASNLIKNYTQLYQYFLGLGLVLFLFAYLLVEKKEE